MCADKSYLDITFKDWGPELSEELLSSTSVKEKMDNQLP